MIATGMDLFRSTVGLAPYQGIEGAVLADPTAMSDGLSAVFRATALSPELQAERLKQQELAKKGEEYKKRVISSSEIDAPRGFLE